ncbi:MAG: GNAT family N-acetyltransferase [Planctomycetota bacterium]|nr:GNAT family N-acetyltransferase [Planctomycetota bacterium]
MSKLSVRLATVQDARKLAVIHVDSWRAAYTGLVPDKKLASLSYAKREKSFRDSLAHGREETWIAEQGDEPVGFATIGPCRDEDTAPSVIGEIWAIYLLPEKWRKGIGADLCRHAEGLLANRGFVCINIWVFRENRSARIFYEHMGYEPDGAQRELNIGKPLTAVRYEKRI